MKTMLLQAISKTVLMGVMGLVVFISLSLGASAGASAAQQVDSWQKQRLLHPTTTQRASEQQGHVFIYDGLSDQAVEQAMDKNFDRIDAMMFVNVKTAKKSSGDAQPDEDADDTEDAGCE